MLNKLTDEQIARFPEFVKKWTDIGLSTDPADRPRAETGIRLAYEIAGKPHPQRIVWCDSPLSMGLTRAIVIGLGSVELGSSVRSSVWDSVRSSVGDSVGDSVWASVGDSVRASVGDSVWASVGDSVRASVRDSVWASVRDSVWASVGDSVGASVRASVRDSVRSSVWDSVWASVGASVWDSVWDSVWASVGASVWDSVWDSGYGQHDAGWLAYYDYFALACSLSEETQKLAGIYEIAQSANWWLPHANICWVSERHRILNRNERGQLHCDNGPALSYPDGWSIWSIDGVRVDEQIVMRPETQEIEQIRAEENEEIRRVRIERFGWLRYLRESGAVIRDSRHNDRDAQNEELYLLSDGTRRFVCVDPSTGRKYALGVPESVDTCEQAQNFVSHGLDKFAIHRS